MAYSFADVPAAELALLANDKPLVMGANVVRSVLSTAIDWSLAFPPTPAAAALGPGVYARDDFTHLQTFPNAANAAWFLYWSWATGVEFDTLAILNHNISGNTVAVQIADDANFTTSLVTIATFSPSSATRLVDLDLNHAGSGSANSQRYSNVQYMRLAFTGGSYVPRVGEVFVAKRRQLKHKPLTGFDPLNLVSAVDRFESSTGVVIDYVRHRGRRKLAAMINPHETAFIDDWIGIFEADTNFGTRPFVWVDDPSTAPTAAYLMLFDPPELVGPIIGPFERDFSFNAIEQGPNFRRSE